MLQSFVLSAKSRQHFGPEKAHNRLILMRSSLSVYPGPVDGLSGVSCRALWFFSWFDVNIFCNFVKKSGRLVFFESFMWCGSDKLSMKVRVAQREIFRHRDSSRVARVRAEYPNQLDYSGFCAGHETAFKNSTGCCLKAMGLLNFDGRWIETKLPQLASSNVTTEPASSSIRASLTRFFDCSFSWQKQH